MKEPNYWFKPKKFGIFASYYPVRWQGWSATVLLAFLFGVSFVLIAQEVSDFKLKLVIIALVAFIFLLIYDIVSFRTGEYPSWWKRRFSETLLREEKSVAPLDAERLATLLQAAETAHATYEKELGHRDENWQQWYARYIVEKLKSDEAK